jgi:hypothetical protein
MLCWLVIAALDCCGNIATAVLAGDPGQEVLYPVLEGHLDAWPEVMGSKKELQHNIWLEFGAEAEGCAAVGVECFL